MGAFANIATGTMAFAGSNGSFARTAAVAGYDEVVESSVWPSGSALLAISAPIMPLAPGRLSTITFLPHMSPRRFATARAMTSVEPPGEYGRISWMFLDGYACAAACGAAA